MNGGLSSLDEEGLNDFYSVANSFERKEICTGYNTKNDKIDDTDDDDIAIIEQFKKEDITRNKMKTEKIGDVDEEEIIVIFDDLLCNKISAKDKTTQESPAKSTKLKGVEKNSEKPSSTNNHSAHEDSPEICSTINETSDKDKSPCQDDPPPAEASATEIKKENVELDTSPLEGFDLMCTKQVGDNMYSCRLCDFKSKTKGKMTQHFRSSHESVKFNCNECDKAFFSVLGLEQHKKYVHNEKFKLCCNICNYQATLKHHLREHIEYKHEGVVYGCDKCDHQARTQRHLKQHIREHHESISYNCDQCDYSSVRKYRLKRHQLNQHEQNSVDVLITCSHCDKAMLKRHLKRHIRSVHENYTKTSEGYFCDKCQKYIKRKNRYIEHKEWHDGKEIGEKRKNFKCSQCPFKARTSYHLKRHMMKHSDTLNKTVTKGRKHKCKICEKAFYEKYLLRYHCETKHVPSTIDAAHEGWKFKCKKCGKDYTRKKVAYNHIKIIHEISEQRNIILHVESIKIELKYNCKKCEYKVNSKAKLQRHIKRQHKSVQVSHSHNIGH